MDGSPQLLTDVKFAQIKRGGYDPDQVDNFLERVSAAVAQLQEKLRVATERAEVADAQIAEARRLQTEAEAGAAASGSSTSTAEVGGGDDELKKVLVLAQRAADQAVDEANTTATRTLADARARAVNLVAEAEQERDQLLAEAREKADAATEQRTHELQQRVKVLEAVRVDLEADADAMQRYLDMAREQLQERLEPVRRLLDDPRGFRLAERPELRNPTLPDDDDDRSDDPDTGDAGTRPDGDPESPSDGDADGAGDDGPRLDTGPEIESADETLNDESASTALAEAHAAPDSPVVDSSLGTASEADLASVEVAKTELPLVDEPVVEEAVADESGADESVVDLSWAPASVASSVPAADAGETIDLTSQRLFGDADLVDEDLVGEDLVGEDLVGEDPPTQIFSPSYESSAPEPAKVDSAADSPLGEPDEAADAAMRAFFDVDIEAAADPPKQRFGRRR